MKKMYNTIEKKTANKIIIKSKDLKVRNELHFNACVNSIAYVSKDKSKVIPRKQKYKGVGHYDY